MRVAGTSRRLQPGRPLRRRLAAVPAARRARRRDARGAARDRSADGRRRSPTWSTRGSSSCPRRGRRSSATVASRSSTSASGIPQPAIWDPVTGEWTEISTGLEGEVSIADWWPDASALLLSQLHDGRYRLHRYEHRERRALAGSSIPRVRWSGRRCDRTAPSGTGTRAAHRSQRILDDAGTGGAAARGRAGAVRPPVRADALREPARRVRAGVRRDADGRAGRGRSSSARTVGRPGSTRTSGTRRSSPTSTRASPSLLLNYRGSTGRGAEWRDTLVGDIGGPELEDLNDALDHLIADGVADPERAVGRRLVLGRLPHADDAGQASRAELAMRDRRGPGRRLRALLRRPVAAPAGLRPRAARRPPGRAPRADGRSEPDQLRRRGARRRCCS